MEYGPTSPELDEATNYQILTADNYLDVITDRQGVRPTETITRGDSEGMRAAYVRNTEELLDKMRAGFADEEGRSPAADMVFYLDKSARPVQWLTDAFWDVFPPENDQIKPNSFFLNLHAAEGPGGGRPSVDGVRAAVEEGGFDRYIAAMREVYPDMADKNILVVDEVSVSGATEELAYQIFRRAFPEAHIKSAAWMQAGKRLDRVGNSYPGEIPVWYKKDSDAGRGIAPIDVEKSLASSSSTQRAGADILSTRPETPDLEAAQLRKEIKQLAHDVQAGRQPIIPAHDIDDPRYDSLSIRQTRTDTPPRPLFN